MGGVTLEWHPPGLPVTRAAHRCLSNVSTACCEACEQQNTRAHHWQDIGLLYTLVRAAGGRPANFIELGAYNGVDSSNTFILEKCYAWRGLLIEANPASFAAMRARSGRDSKQMVHSAICDDSDGAEHNISFATEGRLTAHLASVSTVHGHTATPNKSHVESVPCKGLGNLMREHGYGAGVTFLSLDVEGAEEGVLRTVDVSLFKAIFVEMDGSDVAKDEAVRRRLVSAGLHLYWRLISGAPQRGGVNELYLRPEQTCKPALAHEKEGRNKSKAKGSSMSYAYFPDAACPNAATAPANASSRD